MGLRLALLAFTVAASPAVAAADTAGKTSPSAPGCDRVETAGPDVEAVRQLELRGAAVNVEGWRIEEAREFFAPDWLSIQPDGTDIKLAQVLGRFEDGYSPGWAVRFELPELDIKVYCDSAIAIGRAEMMPRGVDDPTKLIRVRYLNVWRKEGGRWRYAAQQYTRY